MPTLILVASGTEKPLQKSTATNVAAAIIAHQKHDATIRCASDLDECILDPGIDECILDPGIDECIPDREKALYSPCQGWGHSSEGVAQTVVRVGRSRSPQAIRYEAVEDADADSPDLHPRHGERR